MSAQTMTLAAAPRGLATPARIVAVVSVTLGLITALILAGGFYSGHWLLDSQGRAIAGDFVNVWAAGRLTLDGDAAAAYDWTIHKAAEVRAVGHAFDNYYGWHYPPTFLLVAAPLALIPFLPASLIWLSVTLPGYLAAMRAIVGNRAGILLALGFPAVLWNMIAGQNGFLTASLVGGTLTLLDRRPALAGVCLGLLTYKPQFGLLFPLVLVVTARWRVICFATVTSLALAALSWLAFGTAPWLAFFDGLSVTSQAVLGNGRADLNRLQSLFGLVRAHGGSELFAWSAQLAIATLIAGAVCLVWRSRVPFELKAAALAAATLLVTPYMYMYDLVVLAIAVAFIIRVAIETGFTPVEILTLPVAALLILMFPYVPSQVGLAATTIVATLIALRARGALKL